MVIDQFADHHPELVERRPQIEKVLTHEEESFGRTLDAGMARFQELVADLARQAAATGRDGGQTSCPVVRSSGYTTPTASRSI